MLGWWRWTDYDGAPRQPAGWWSLPPSWWFRLPPGQGRKLSHCRWPSTIQWWVLRPWGVGIVLISIPWLRGCFRHHCSSLYNYTQFQMNEQWLYLNYYTWEVTHIRFPPGIFSRSYCSLIYNLIMYPWWNSDFVYCACIKSIMPVFFLEEPHASLHTDYILKNVFLTIKKTSHVVCMVFQQLMREYIKFSKAG